MKKRYSEEQIVQILREADTAPTKAEVCRKYGISEWTYYRWKKQYQGLEVSQLRRLKQLESENARLKKLVADQALANEALKEALEKRGSCEREAADRVRAGGWRDPRANGVQGRGDKPHDVPVQRARRRAVE